MKIQSGHIDGEGLIQLLEANKNIPITLNAEYVDEKHEIWEEDMQPHVLYIVEVDGHLENFRTYAEALEQYIIELSNWE